MKKVRAFLMAPSRSRDGSPLPYKILAARSIFLPGVHCPICNETWSTSGLIYPTITGLKGMEFLHDPRPVPFARYAELERQTRKFLPADQVLRPGTQFGALAGSANGYPEDIMWHNQWTPLLSESLFSTLSESGINLRVGLSVINTMEMVGRQTLLELEAAPLVDLLPVGACSFIPKVTCEHCGRRAAPRPTDFCVNASTYDDSQALQRSSYWPTVLVANVQFADAITTRKLKGVSLKEITVE